MNIRFLNGCQKTIFSLYFLLHVINEFESILNNKNYKYKVLVIGGDKVGGGDLK